MTLLYLRSRQVPAALGVAVGGAVTLWALWLAFAESREAAVALVAMTVVLMVTAFAVTLAGPDPELDRTASLRWRPWRVAHLLAVVVVVVLALTATLPTGAAFGPVWLVLRDAGGLLGLTALGAVVAGAARSWFVPLGWTMVAALFPFGGTWGSLLTWQSRPYDDRISAIVAAVLAVGGLVAYTVAGPARRDAAE